MGKILKAKKCLKCGIEYLPNSGSSKYCSDCKIVMDKERKKQWYIKNNPNAYEEKPIKKCCVCGGKFGSSFQGKPYCNKHYLRMYFNGSPDLKPNESKNAYQILDDCVELKTTKGVIFKIDKDDFEKVSKYTWCLSKTGYLVANLKGKVTKLHRYILSAPSSLLVDHINGNPLDNKKSNLRLCDGNHNTKNCKLGKNNLTGYSGISLLPNGKYRVRIMVDRKEISLGWHDTFESALKERLEAEQKYFAEFAPSNGALKQFME